MRPRISAAALFVNVTAIRPCGETPFDVDQPGGAMHQHAGLAAAGAGDNEHRLGRRRHSFPLRVIQRFEDGGNVHQRACPEHQEVAQSTKKAVDCVD